jgi:8-oxo-dGTP pyrophosphatase MutT (NUDIX family)
MAVDIRQRSTRAVYENRWMRVREDEIERADGSSGVFGVVEKPDFALIIPRGRESVHLVEQFRYPVGGRFWEFPQGSWEEQPDVDPAELARAELEEETGLRAGSLRHLGHLYEAYGYSNQGFNVFLATELEQTTRRATVEEQDLRQREIAIAEFEAMIRAGEIKDAPTIAAWGLLNVST